MEFAVLNGAGMRYELRGQDGPVIVLLHEMGGLLENWDEVVPGLADKYRVLRYDYRGFGLSEKIAGDLHITTLGDDLLALLDSLGFTEPVTLAGCAVGAAIALHFAGRFGDRVSGVIALSPAVEMDPSVRESRLEMLGSVTRGGMRTIMEGALAAGYPQVLRDRNPERFRAFQARWLANDPESFAASYRMLIDMDISADIAAIRCRTLGVGGTLDTFRSPEYVRNILAPIPGVEFVTIETSHHQMAATPVEITAILREFMEGRSPSWAASGT